MDFFYLFILHFPITHVNTNYNKKFKSTDMIFRF